MWKNRHRSSESAGTRIVVESSAQSNLRLKRSVPTETKVEGTHFYDLQSNSHLPTSLNRPTSIKSGTICTSRRAKRRGEKATSSTEVQRFRPGVESLRTTFVAISLSRSMKSLRCSTWRMSEKLRGQQDERWSTVVHGDEDFRTLACTV